MSLEIRFIKLLWMNGMEEFVKKLAKSFEDEDSAALRDISNKAIEEAVMNEEPLLVNISLIAYSLSKLVTKPHLLKSPKWIVFKKDILDHLQQVPTEKLLEQAIKDVIKFDAETGNYVEDLIYKARVKQASRAYALGLSLGKAASLTNVPKEELSRYVGKTLIHERPFVQSKTVRERYKIARDVFG